MASRGQSFSYKSENKQKKKSRWLSLLNDVLNLNDRELFDVWGEKKRAENKMMNLAALVHSLRWSLLHIESRLLQVAGLEQHLGEFNDYSYRR